MTETVQLTLDHAPNATDGETPNEYRWYSWSRHFHADPNQARYKTPAFAKQLAELIEQVIPRYREATGHDAKYIILQSPARVLEYSHRVNQHGPFGQIAGLQVCMDLSIGLGTFGLAHQMDAKTHVPPHHQSHPEHV